MSFNHSPGGRLCLSLALSLSVSLSVSTTLYFLLLLFFFFLHLCLHCVESDLLSLALSAVYVLLNEGRPTTTFPPPLSTPHYYYDFEFYSHVPFYSSRSSIRIPSLLYFLLLLSTSLQAVVCASPCSCFHATRGRGRGAEGGLKSVASHRLDLGRLYLLDIFEGSPPARPPTEFNP